MRPSSCGSLASLSDGTCWVGITRRWVGAWGLMSRNAISPSPRFTIVAGISPAATLQKRQPDMGPLPSERLADLLPELLAAALFRRRLRLDHGEPLQQLLLLRRETRGGPDAHTHVQVAPPALTQSRQPLAPHAGQGATETNGPNIERAWRRTSPVPPHVPQAVGRVPSLAPAPPHAVQRSSVRTRTVFVVPAATSASVSLSVTFRSAPRCRSRARSPPPKIASNPPRLPKSRMKMLSASDRSKWVKPNPPSPPPPPPPAPPAPPAPAPPPRRRPPSPQPA